MILNLNVFSAFFFNCIVSKWCKVLSYSWHILVTFNLQYLSFTQTCICSLSFPFSLFHSLSLSLSLSLSKTLTHIPISLLHILSLSPSFTLSLYFPCLSLSLPFPGSPTLLHHRWLPLLYGLVKVNHLQVEKTFFSPWIFKDKLQFTSHWCVQPMHWNDNNHSLTKVITSLFCFKTSLWKYLFSFKWSSFLNNFC